ncbi:hypothetical protein AB0J14_05240 [Micromonospora arborensis]|uniref:hypothetical protein n=1 Tax=Micromonospora arborensis TaxID=2116518 RepID=UPI0033D203E1
MDAQNPLTVLRDRYWSESYWPEDYLPGATLLLGDLELLAREVTDEDRAVATAVLEALHDTGLDVTDVFPLGTVWALRSTGLIAARPDLDTQLAEWRKWEETDHLGEPLDFLPELRP